MIREHVGKAELYRNHAIQAVYMGPDLLVEVDTVELGNFYLTREAALAAGRRYVDEKLKEPR